MKRKDKHVEGCEFPFVWTLECFNWRLLDRLLWNMIQKPCRRGLCHIRSNFLSFFLTADTPKLRAEKDTLAVTKISNRLNSSKYKSRSDDCDKDCITNTNKIIK